MTSLTDFGKLIAFEAPALPSLTPLSRGKERILGRWPDVVALPPEKDRERLVQEIKRRLEADDWRDTPMSMVTSAARALFDEQRRARPDLAGVRAFYYGEIRASTRQSFLDAMLAVHVGTYEPNALHTKDLARELTRARDRLGPRSQQLLASLPELLDPVRAPEQIASRMARMDDCWKELKALGMRSPHGPGVMDFAHLAYLSLLAPVLKTRTGLERLFGWLKPEGQREARTTGAAEAIAAVISPWLRNTPKDADVTYITENLIGLYGDPRVSAGGAWAGVPPEHLALLMRWLTGENIRFFLDVVSAVEESHMWEPRRRFWLKLHEQKRIDAAWVAFSPSAADHARRQLAARGDRALLSFGEQIAKGTRLHTSLLVLKVGNKIVIEGSHNYKVHVFRQDNNSAPKLYQRYYNCDLIRLMKGAEAKSHNGDWQSWVMERI